LTFVNWKHTVFNLKTILLDSPVINKPICFSTFSCLFISFDIYTKITSPWTTSWFHVWNLSSAFPYIFINLFRQKLRFLS